MMCKVDFIALVSHCFPFDWKLLHSHTIVGHFLLANIENCFQMAKVVTFHFSLVCVVLQRSTILIFKPTLIPNRHSHKIDGSPGSSLHWDQFHLLHDLHHLRMEKKYELIREVK